MPLAGLIELDTNEAVIAILLCPPLEICSMRGYIQMSGESFREGLQPSLSPVLQAYDALKSAFVAGFAALEATADGLIPFAISQIAKTSSCGRIGILRIAWIVPAGGMRWNITNTALMMVNVIPNRPQTVSHRGTSLNW